MLMSAKALLLVLVANSAPILVRRLPLLDKLSYPLDCGIRFVDGSRLLGYTKTWRGMIAAVLVTMLCSIAMQSGWFAGLVVALFAMLGDSFSSFIKRRLTMAPSTMAIGLDQIPESLLPLVCLHYLWQLGWLEVGVLVLLFVILDLVLSRILFYLHIRKRPY
jgi:CDP-diglyceride synthetase